MAGNADEGKIIFSSACAVCHGPNGLGVAGLGKPLNDAAFLSTQDDAYLRTTILKGRPGTSMQAFSHLGETKVGDLVAFIRSWQSGPAGATTSSGRSNIQSQESVFDTVAVARGRDLFQGNIRFREGGPSCISCHHVKNDALIGGGLLARELTTVFSKMGSAGIQAALVHQPFPVMEQAYRGRALSQNEVDSLTAFLWQADKENLTQRPKNYGTRLLLFGGAGGVFLIALYSLIWGRRKTRSVNHDIFSRQIKSE